jgi:hypothetical protein
VRAPQGCVGTQVTTLADETKRPAEIAQSQSLRFSHANRTTPLFRGIASIDIAPNYELHEKRLPGILPGTLF